MSVAHVKLIEDDSRQLFYALLPLFDRGSARSASLGAPLGSAFGALSSSINKKIKWCGSAERLAGAGHSTRKPRHPGRGVRRLGFARSANEGARAPGEGARATEGAERGSAQRDRAQRRTAAQPSSQRLPPHWHVRPAGGGVSRRHKVIETF